MLPFCRFQRQWCIKILCPKDPDFYTPLALKMAKGQHLPALVVYKNQSPILAQFYSKDGPTKKCNKTWCNFGIFCSPQIFFISPKRAKKKLFFSVETGPKCRQQIGLKAIVILSLNCLASTLTAGVILTEEKKPSLEGERQFRRHFRRQFGRG